MTNHLGDRRWTEFWDPRRRPLLAVPVGSCEQHGPHLPLDTDTRIAMALADGLVSTFAAGEVVVAPPLTITASGEHGSFPGTLSIGTTVLEQVIIELVRSADWAAGVVLINGHGGNKAPVQRAVSQLSGERRRVLAWWPTIEGADAHAGHEETAMMLALAPDLVHMDRAEVGRTEPLSQLIGEIREGGIQAVSSNGILGDPRRATAGQGRAMLTKLSIDLVRVVDDWWE
ncbi:MAG: mycofactocin biosynthesis peptidyl-dipeptidase MftE [Ilumatobacteraceae bacterium]